MSDEDGGPVWFESHPDPVCQYAVEDDRALVTATNPPFDDQFESVGSGTPVARVFERFESVDSSGEADPATHVARGDDVSVSLDGGEADGQYVARIAGDGEAGHVVFTDLEGLDDVSGVGVDAATRVISHDLRNPLDVAQANLQAARETGEAEYFDAVERAHDRMTRIIRDVLTLARGDAVVDPAETVDLAAVANDAWETVSTDRGRLRVREPLPDATADADRVQRLFENLFRNAIEHGTTGEDHAVTIRVGPLDDGFYVVDGGPGIPATERDAVFDPGYTSTDRGAGIGLAIVERIADAHGWTVDLTAGEDGGARFEFSVTRSSE